MWDHLLQLPKEKIREAMVDVEPDAVVLGAGAWFLLEKTQPDYMGFQDGMNKTLRALTDLQKEVGIS